jgi:hypothetical protein
MCLQASSGRQVLTTSRVNFYKSGFKRSMRTVVCTYIWAYESAIIQLIRHRVFFFFGYFRLGSGVVSGEPMQIET